MMNPFIAALMQQSEQASKDALARQEQQSAGLGLALGMMGGGFGGEGGLFGGSEGPLAPTEAAYTPPTDVIGPTYRAPTVTPPAPAYAPPVTMADPASQPFTPAGPVDIPPIGMNPAAIAEKWARNDPGATTPAPLTVNEKWTLNDPGATPQTKAQEVAAAVLGPAPAAPAAVGGGLGDEPINMAKYLQWSGRDLGMTPQQYQQEGVAVPDWGYVAPTMTPTLDPYTLSPNGWNGTQAVIDGSAGGLSGMLRQGAGDNMSALLEGPYMEAQQRFGQNIPILDALAKAGTSREEDTPGSRHFFGDALDIDISGFSNEERLGLLDALTASGFTDFGLGANSLHADKRGRGGNWSYGGGYGGLSYNDAVARLNQGRQAYASGNVPELPPMGGEQGWALVGGDASLYPGTLPEWLSPGQPTETMMTKNNPTAPIPAGGNFDQLLPLVLEHEGGYSNHPQDSGGATMNGVTQARYDQYRRDNGLPTQDVRNLAENERSEIYRKYYFDEVRGSELPPGVDYAMFDFAVNSGPSRAIKFTQEILGLPADGKMGPETMAAIQAADPAQLSAALNDKRLSWLQGLGDWEYFGKGWGNRVNDVSATSQRFASRGVPSTQPPGAATSGADDWVNPYNNRNLAMVGGVNGSGGLYHDWGSRNLWAHDNDYEDYSQFYREFTYEPKDGYVPVGERDGKTVYAAPAPEYVDGKPVDRNLYVSEARRRGALIPTEAEMRALYEQAQPVPMPTIPNGGGPNDRISFDNVPDGPWYGPKEFYRTNDSPALPTNFAEAMQDPQVARMLMQQILLGG